MGSGRGRYCGLYPVGLWWRRKRRRLFRWRRQQQLIVEFVEQLQFFKFELVELKLKLFEFKFIELKFW